MRDIIDESDDSASAAISYTEEFFDAAVAKIDATFGKGFAKDNPALLGAMVQASSTNLGAFMQAASMMQTEMLGMLEQLPPEMFTSPQTNPSPPKRTRKTKGV